MPTLTAKNTPEGIRDALQSVLDAAAGRGPDITGGLVQGLLLRMGMAMLSQVKQAFEIKSQGLVGPDGIKWKALSPYTIARRRLGPGDKKLVTLKARAPTLTPAEKQKMAKEINRRTVDIMAQYGLPHGQAAGLARAQIENKWRKVRQVFGRPYQNIPWLTSKLYTAFRPTLAEIRKITRGGAITSKGVSPGAVAHIFSKFGILSQRHVLILEDTGELHRSFSPGVDGDILEAQKGRIIIGTNKKPWHHFGSKDGKLPERNYWPRDGNLPDVYWDAISGAAVRGLGDIVRWLAQNARP